MGNFTEAEIQYLRDQPIGRFATVGPGGRPQIAAVGVLYDPAADSVVITGADFSQSQKFRNAQARPDVSFLVDDVASTDPWRPRGIEIRGRAEIHLEDDDPDIGDRIGTGMPFHTGWILLRPRRILSWGIDSGWFDLTRRDVA